MWYNFSMTNFLFVDDSGSKGWDIPYAQDFVDTPPVRSDDNRSFWQSNYFVLAGIHIDSETMAELNSLISQKKMELFGTRYVELHSVDLRSPHLQRRKYLKPYGIKLEKLREFIDDFWYPLFDQHKMQLVAIVVDKRYYNNGERSLRKPLEIAAEALFEQTESHPNKNCKIVFDQMDSQIKSCRRDQGRIMQIANMQVELDDGKYGNKFHHTSLAFDKSSNSNFLQLADMVAYNTWRQFVEYGNEWEAHVDDPDSHRVLPMYPYFEKIADGFYCDGDSIVSGVGLIKLPDPYNDCPECRHWKIRH